MKLPRRKVLHLVASGIVFLETSRIALALDYPQRPVRLIVGFFAGGLSDILARLLSPRLSERFGQQFIVEDQPGAGTNLAAEAVVRAPPDGYTLLMATSANAINATLYDNLKFNFIRDTAPVASIARTPHVMVVNPSFPAKTVLDFITYAKANPGKINMATAGIGSPVHLAGELFMTMTESSWSQCIIAPVTCRICSPDRCKWCSAQYPRQSSRSKRASCAPLQRPVRHVRRRCQSFRRSVSLCRATRLARGTA